MSISYIALLLVLWIMVSGAGLTAFYSADIVSNDRSQRNGWFALGFMWFMTGSFAAFTLGVLTSEWLRA